MSGEVPTMDERWEATAKPTQVMREILITPKPGLGMLGLFLSGLALAFLLFVLGAASKLIVLAVLAVLAGIASFIGLIGLFTVGPNEAKVLQFFGNYTG